MRTPVWLRCLVVLLGAGGIHDAWALSCFPPPTDSKVRAQAFYAEAAAVFVGQVVDLGPEVLDEWHVWAPGRLKVERWFKGAASPEIRVLLPGRFRPGARLLVFARTNTLDDRLRQTEVRRHLQRLDSKQIAGAVKRPDADIPGLTAAGACEESAFPLEGAGVQSLPDSALSSWVASSNEMLKVLQATPAVDQQGVPAKDAGTPTPAPPR